MSPVRSHPRAPSLPTYSNDVAYFQVSIARKYMRRHNLTPLQFIERDKQYHILHFLEIGYEPFHLTGDESVLDELNEIVAEQQSSTPREECV